jgi:hypothetical protein
MFVFLMLIDLYSPKRSSPKLPHPIFLPTRKFGPTISIPDELPTEWRAEYMPVAVRPPAATADGPAAGAPLK